MHQFSAAYQAVFSAILLSALSSAALAETVPGESLRSPTAISPAYPTAASADAEWTALADMTLASTVILRGTVARTRRLSGKAAADVPAGSARILVEVDLANVLKAPGLLPARAEWLWQGPLSPEGKQPVRAGQSVLAFLLAPRGGTQPDIVQFQLVAPTGQRLWDDRAEAAVRTILTESRRGDALMVVGVADGFRAPGAVSGAAETQFFLRTDLGRPLTLVVTRTPDASPKVRVATGDVIASSTTAVEPATLLWRALACGLPEELPERLRADPELQADYDLARASFGACGRRAF